jgi:hypothetical protein
MVRTADVKRGWGKFYSKSCKAKQQERRTHQHRRHREDNYDPDYDVHPFSEEAVQG